jgi:hypothetical protein
MYAQFGGGFLTNTLAIFAGGQAFASGWLYQAMQSQQLSSESLLPKIQYLVNKIDNLSVSVFWDPTDGYPFGFSFNYTAATRGKSGWLGVSLAWYELLTPNVAFW